MRTLPHQYSDCESQDYEKILRVRRAEQMIDQINERACRFGINATTIIRPTIGEDVTFHVPVHRVTMRQRA